MIMPTKELLEKSQKGHTAEIIDLLLQKNIISSEEHYVGIKLRLIRNQRFGKPYAKSRDIFVASDDYIEREEGVMDEQNQLAYRQAVKMLGNIRAREIMLNVCVFDIMPSSLHEFSKLKEGFALLVAVFKEYLAANDNYNLNELDELI